MITISKKQTSVLAVITALAVIMVVAPAVLSVDNFSVFAKHHHHGHHHHHNHHGHHHGKSNHIDQSISQHQSSHQNSQVVSGGNSVNSGNNFSFQNQKNTGSNAAAQQ